MEDKITLQVPCGCGCDNVLLFHIDTYNNNSPQVETYVATDWVPSFWVRLKTTFKYLFCRSTILYGDTIILNKDNIHHFNIVVKTINEKFM